MVLDSPLFITLLCSEYFRNSARLILLIITGIISYVFLALVATSLLNLDEDLTGDPLSIRLSCNDLHPCSIQWTDWITIQLNVKHGLVGRNQIGRPVVEMSFHSVVFMLHHSALDILIFKLKIDFWYPDFHSESLQLQDGCKLFGSWRPKYRHRRQEVEGISFVILCRQCSS